MKRFTAFIREKGFYLALLACILAAAASSVWAIRTVVGRLNGTAESQSSSEEEFVWDAPELPVERNAEDVPIEPNELRGSSPSSLPEATSGRLWAAGRLAGSLLCLAGAWADARALQRG